MTNRLLQLLSDNRAFKARRFEAQTRTDDGANEPTIYLYDTIVDDALTAEYFGGVHPEAFVQQLNAISAPVMHLRINSPGGSVFAARSMEQAMREHPAKIIVHVDGVAASAASFMAMAGDEIIINAGGMIMIHKAWTMGFGNSDDLLHTAALLEKIDGTLIDTYAARTGQAPQQLATWMAAETWFTGAEAVAAGFADRLASEPGAQAGALTGWNLTAFKRPPSSAPSAPAAAAPLAQPQVDAIDAAAYLRRLDAAVLTA